MKVPLDWLKEFVDIENVPITNMAQLMTNCGLEVDAFDHTHLEVSQTPDLGYTRSMIGVARFLKQLYDLEVKHPKIHPFQEVLEAPKITIEPNTKDYVPQYCLRSIRGIQNGDSPDWMQRRLKACGMQPKNLIVDVTNYVQLALGQPLHAFDEDRLQGPLHVELSSRKTPFTTLLDTQLEIPPSSIIITSKGRVEAVAGVIGAKESAVSLETTNILLESAKFSSTCIRRTSKGMKLSTPSSQRFENQTDPEMVELALNLATSLIVHHGKGAASHTAHLMSSKQKPHTATLHLKRVESLLGIKTHLDELKEVMRRIDARILGSDAVSIQVEMPMYRTDLLEEIDLVEEVIKILGFDRLIEGQAHIPLVQIPQDAHVEFKRLVRKKMLQQGLTEMMTPSLINKDHLLSPNDSIEVKNALSDRSILRTTHLYGALESVLHNQNHHMHELEGFEIGTVYYKEGPHFKEHTMISITLENERFDFLDLKGAFETLFHQLHIGENKLIVSHLPHLHPHRQGSLEVRGQCLGTIGEVHPALLKKFGIKKRVLFGEISLDALMHNTPKAFHIAPISNYPSIERDTTLTLNKSISYGFLEALIAQYRPSLLQSYSLKGIYDPDPAAKLHNVTMHWVFRSQERSLTQDEVEEKMREFLNKLHHEINS
jgi:phenylalanyl-tRNA synthetase beta chain